MTQNTNRPTLPEAWQAPQAMGDGLVLRWSTADDVERIAELSAHVFRDKPDEPPNARNAAWIRDLGSGRHPLTAVDQGVFVEDTRSGKVVASMWLIPTSWTFGAIRFGVGRPESVVSHPDYRRHGLVRALFAAFHARSARAGELAQAITGIPYYYRQFGYEMALELGGRRFVQFDDIPPLKGGEAEPFTLRPAMAADLPFVRELYEHDRQRSLISADIPEPYWRWMLDGISAESGEGWSIALVVAADGERRGFILPRKTRGGKTLAVLHMVLAQGTPWTAAIRPILRGLRDYAAGVPPWRDPAVPSRLAFDFGTAHPAYSVLGDDLAPRRDGPYAWYVRVPDLPGFVQHVAPVLEARLQASPLAGYSGDLHLDFYRGGLRLAFEHGQLTAARDWQRPVFSADLAAVAGFPPLVFLQLLFGRRSRAELEHIMPDVWSSDEAAALLDTLFPALPSFALNLD